MRALKFLSNYMYLSFPKKGNISEYPIQEFIAEVNQLQKKKSTIWQQVLASTYHVKMGSKTKEKMAKLFHQDPHTYTMEGRSFNHAKKTKRCLKFLLYLHSNQILIFEET